MTDTLFVSSTSPGAPPSCLGLNPAAVQTCCTRAWNEIERNATFSYITIRTAPSHARHTYTTCPSSPLGPSRPTPRAGSAASTLTPCTCTETVLYRPLSDMSAIHNKVTTLSHACVRCMAALHWLLLRRHGERAQRLQAHLQGTQQAW